MSKQVTDTGELWSSETQTGNVQLGFTQSFLNKHQQECWHIIPQLGKVKKGMVLMSLETNDGLVPVKAPFDGDIVTFENDALNFPEKLTEDTGVIVLRLQKEEPKKAADYLKKDNKPKKTAPDVRAATPLADAARARQAEIVRPRRQENRTFTMEWDRAEAVVRMREDARRMAEAARRWAEENPLPPAPRDRDEEF